MTALVLPIPSIVNTRGSATLRTQLDGRDYVVVLQWNQRQQRWSMDVADQDGDMIAAGIVLVVDFPLLSLVTDERRPPGTLAVIDPQSPRIDPTLESLGSRHLVCYYPEE
jgi:hypothetical protein